MFNNCSSLNSLNLSNFNTINVKNMGYMLFGIKKKCNIIVNDEKLKEKIKEDSLSEKINNEPENAFSKYIFEYINKIRRNPQEFFQEIEDSKSKITTAKKERLFLNQK